MSWLPNIAFERAENEITEGVGPSRTELSISFEHSPQDLSVSAAHLQTAKVTGRVTCVTQQIKPLNRLSHPFQRFPILMMSLGAPSW